MKYLLIICFLAINLSLSAMPTDSIGMKTVNGQTYIMHKVSKGEGVYAIARKYGVSASDVFSANAGSDKGIKIDQILLIPKTLTASKSEKTNTKTEKIYHTVAKGETLSAIAREYNTTVADLKEWNDLKSDNINLNQKLIVGEKNSTVVVQKTESKPVIKEEIVEEKKQTPPPANQVPSSTSNNAVVKSSTETAQKEESSKVVNTYSTDDGDEISENGTAVISSDGDLSQERSFVLHPTAKIGTIIMITNPENGNTVFARVVGNCKSEEGVVMKMSKTVAMKLGVSENTVVKISYAK
jgi:LysM repeat protein